MARKIYDSGFRPTFVVGIWRGGAPISIVIHDFLQYHGINTDSCSIKTRSYTGSVQGSVIVDGCQYLFNHAHYTDRLLLVDDIFDTGRTCKAIIEHLKEHMKTDIPQEIRIAAPYYKPSLILNPIISYMRPINGSYSRMNVKG